MQRRYFSFNNLKLSYLEAGESNEKKLLITHANGYAAGCYAYIIEALAQKYHVVALDFAGYGASEGTLEYSSWNFFRDQVFAIMDHKGWKTCIAIGHSLGGGSLLRAAEADSGRFEKILALDPVLIGWLKTIYVKIWGNPMAKVALGRRWRFKSKEQAYKIFERLPANKSWDKRSIRDYVEFCIRETATGAELCSSPETEARTFSIAEFAPLLELKKIRCPVHFLLPEKSRVINNLAVRRILKANKESSLQRLRGVGHLFPFEDHALTLHSLKECL